MFNKNNYLKNLLRTFKTTKINLSQTKKINNFK